MNYSNMIPDQNKNLKKAFIVSVLVSTIAGTFTTAINLFDRLAETRKQHRKDRIQDSKIKELERQVDDAEKKKKEPRRDDDVQNSLAQGAPMVRRQYDQGYQRLGPQFAQGDATAQIQLQAQLIMLQSEVIMMLQEGVMSGRVRDMNRLYNASELAREGSLNALRDQYQRMLQAAPVRPGSVRRVSSTPLLAPLRRAAVGREPPATDAKKPSTGRTDGATAHASEDGEGADAAGPGAGGDPTSGTKVMRLDDAAPLFCRYAVALQRSDEPLEARFRPAGPLACPACGTRVEVRFGRSWRISRQVPAAAGRRHQRFEDGVAAGAAAAVEERTYLLGNRFVVKCHREQAGFACLLCARYRDKDTVCATADGLVKHVWRSHEVGEYEGDVDIREVRLARDRSGKRH